MQAFEPVRESIRQAWIVKGTWLGSPYGNNRKRTRYPSRSRKDGASAKKYLQVLSDCQYQQDRNRNEQYLFVKSTPPHFDALQVC